MKRRQLVELEDLPWWPRTLRDAMTDYLVTAIRVTKAYDGLAPRLADALRRSDADRVVDLCSGGGGPWPGLLPDLRARGVDASLTLTDKFPNAEALGRVAATSPGIAFEPGSVDATDVPAHLGGFRTIFSALHHFRPADATAILASAVRDRRGILVAEAIARTPAALATMALVPLAVLLMTPAIRPFRWSRLVWTYLVPILPAAIAFDGVVSYLRTYTPDELRTMAHAADPAGSFNWDAGEAKPPGSPIATPYLIGVPRG